MVEGERASEGDWTGMVWWIGGEIAIRAKVFKNKGVIRIKFYREIKGREHKEAVDVGFMMPCQLRETTFSRVWSKLRFVNIKSFVVKGNGKYEGERWLITHFPPTSVWGLCLFEVRGRNQAHWKLPRVFRGSMALQHLDQKWIPTPIGMELGGILCFSVLFLCSQFLMENTSLFFHPPSLCTSFLSSFLSIGSVHQILLINSSLEPAISLKNFFKSFIL